MVFKRSLDKLKAGLRKTRDILLMDMERVEYVWNKIQDINTARALAKRDNTYFMVEEKLWWDLHSIFRDPAKLYAVTSRPSSVLVIVGLWEEGKGRMIHTVQIEMSFMARVCDLRDTASRQLRSRHLHSRMLALRLSSGTGRLIQELGANEGVLYMVLQDTLGIVAAGGDVVKM